jgi:hypothetical protein
MPNDDDDGDDDNNKNLLLCKKYKVFGSEMFYLKCLSCLSYQLNLQNI